MDTVTIITVKNPDVTGTARMVWIPGAARYELAELGCAEKGCLSSYTSHISERAARIKLGPEANLY